MKKLPTFLIAPFLVTNINKDGEPQYFIIDSWNGRTIGAQEDGTFTQAYEWTVHKATDEEVTVFSEEKEKAGKKDPVEWGARDKKL